MFVSNVIQFHHTKIEMDALKKKLNVYGVLCVGSISLLFCVQYVGVCYQ